MPISRRSLCLGCLSSALVGVASRALANSATSARTVLLSRGLIPSSGNYWLVPAEVPLRRAAESLDALERAHHAAVSKAMEMLTMNEAIRARLAQAEEIERAQRPGGEPAGSVPSAAGSGASGAAPAGKLNSRMPDVTGLGEQTPLQQAMIAAVHARAAVQLAILTIRREAPALDARYQPLKADTEIQGALRQLDRKARLGPARHYPRDVARAEALAAGAFRKEVLGYLESGQFRISVVLNESCSATVSFRQMPGPLLLTTSVVQRLGIPATPDSGATQTLEVGGRLLQARPLRLASLRLGATVLKDVPALILPPEAEDLGSTLHASVLTGYQASPQLRRMTLTLSPEPAK